MVSVYDVKPLELIEAVAKKLENSVKAPEWAKFVKTGVHKERPPVQDNWWIIRAAAILRTLYKDGPIGVSKLRSKYGGAKNRGVEPHCFKKGSGKVIRTIVQQLETAGLVQKNNTKVHKGRVVSPAGQSLLEKTATEVFKAKPKVEKPKPEPTEKESSKKEEVKDGSKSRAPKTAAGAVKEGPARKASNKGSKSKTG